MAHVQYMYTIVVFAVQGRFWLEWCIHGGLLSAGEAKGGGNGGHLPVH